MNDIFSHQPLRDQEANASYHTEEMLRQMEQEIENSKSRDWLNGNKFYDPQEKSHDISR